MFGSYSYLIIAMFVVHAIDCIMEFFLRVIYENMENNCVRDDPDNDKRP